jgi:hypothetical protein
VDPDANLREQRELSAAIIRTADGEPFAGRTELQATRAERLAELVQALEEWVMKGGAMPDDWQAAQARASARRIVKATRKD